LTREEKVGLLAFSLDGEPILGRIDALPGLFVGTAFHSGGFAYNPVAGMLLAELVADGVTSIDISAFSPDQFEAGEVADFTDSSVTQGEYTGIGGRRRH
jgi:glycine/D-amino acid oxidase-like deaminating enzyme